MIGTAIAATERAETPIQMFLDNPATWVTLSFVLFILLIGRPAWKFVIGHLDNRIDLIRNKIEEATKLREEAQDILAENKRQMADADNESREILAKVRDDIQELKTNYYKELEQALQRRERAAVEQIALAETEALKSVKNFTVDVALEATRELLQHELMSENSNDLINKAIKELPHKLT